MEQNDYILREIEKIGLILRAIRQKLFGSKENLSVTLNQQSIDVKEMLLNGTNFDFDKFLSLNIEDSNKYLQSFQGFSIENIELLAECIAQMGFTDNSSSSKIYLEKAFQLFELCNSKSKTYSFERETSIKSIKNLLGN